MKNFRWSALVLAVAGAAATGCSESGCGNPTTLDGTSKSQPTVTCGSGTSLQNGVCLPSQAAKAK